MPSFAWRINVEFTCRKGTDVGDNHLKKRGNRLLARAPCGHNVSVLLGVTHSAIAAHLANKSDMLFTSTLIVFLSFIILPAHELSEVFFLVTVVLRVIFFDFLSGVDICSPWLSFFKKMNDGSLFHQKIFLLQTS